MVKPSAKPFYRAALLGFEHALTHSQVDGELDAVQVILSLDFGTEMLLKAVLLDRGISIMERPKRSIGLVEALSKCGPYVNGSSIEVLRERRDSLQHFATYTDAATTRDLYEATMLFVEEVHSKDFESALPEVLEIRGKSASAIPSLLLSESDALQRDVHASESGLAVWAQGAPGTNSLAIHARFDAATSFVLTPDEEFEYMPKTDGKRVVCYRQSGGVVLYDLETQTRELISEHGGPTAILGDWIAAQGLDIESGLGGGIWLRGPSNEWERVSDGGDSARLTDDGVFWQEFDGDKVNIKFRPLNGGDHVFLIRGGNHPSPDNGRIAWTDWGVDGRLHVGEMDGTELYNVAGGIFPNLRGKLLAYLKEEGGTYGLFVDDIEQARNLISLPWVGFPFGSGPVLAKGEVFFESSASRATNAVWRALVSS